MANYYAQATLAAASGETADVNVNIFSFIGPNVFTPTEGNLVNGWISDFYDTLETNNVLCGRAQTGHTIKIYPAVTTTPNYPIDESSFNLTGSPPGVDLPLEVNLCISYANDSATIVPRARRRGRIYISGFTELMNTAGRPTSTVYQLLADTYLAYVDAMNAEPDFAAAIWSRTNGSLYPIERIWCDDEWDTMRSRGGKSTTRYTVTPTP